MAIEKEGFFKIIEKVSESQDLNEDNLLGRIKNELKEKDGAEYGKFCLNMDKNHLFSIRTSEETSEDWTLLHFAAGGLCCIARILERGKAF